VLPVGGIRRRSSRPPRRHQRIRPARALPQGKWSTSRAGQEGHGVLLSPGWTGLNLTLESSPWKQPRRFRRGEARPRSGLKLVFAVFRGAAREACCLFLHGRAEVLDSIPQPTSSGCPRIQPSSFFARMSPAGGLGSSFGSGRWTIIFRLSSRDAHRPANCRSFHLRCGCRWTGRSFETREAARRPSTSSFDVTEGRVCLPSAEDS